MNRILVLHPVQQHAHQLAWALQERGLLQAFWSGVPVVEQGDALPFWLREFFGAHVKTVGIPRRLRRHPLIFPALLRLSRVLPPGMSRQDYIHRVLHSFDWWASRQIEKLRPEAVVAYENSAFHTFRAASAIGARCILDAPSLHHRAQAALAGTEQTRYLREINRRKDMEISQADMILTCSALAAQSYLDAGIPAAKVKTVAPGAALPDGIEPWSPHDGPVRFIFAGGLHHLKSIDLILAAFQRLHQEDLPYRLTLVGLLRQPEWRKQIQSTPGAKHLSPVPQTELYRLFSQSDCLLLPSRFDSFGMVVAEAMSCGTPAIVSTQTGAQEIMRLFPGSGWIVEPNAESLYRCLRTCIQAPDRLSSARPAALEASRHFTWEAYRERVGALIGKWLT